MGNTIPSAGTIIYPAAAPQPVASNDIVGVVIQNISGADNKIHYYTFGQIFAEGVVHTTDTLVGRVYGAAYQVQMDPLALWPDGSVKLAAITIGVSVCANEQLPVLLSKATSSDPVFSTTAVSLTASTVNLITNLAFTSGQYTGTQSVNLGSALKLALANTPTYWLQGPLATQARIDVPLSGGPMHLTADVTAYQDGTVVADVQFNNDLTSVISGTSYDNPNPLAPQVYNASITLNGAQTSYTGITQYQYQDWHAIMSVPALPQVNVQHDLAYLEHAGAVLPYDRTTGVSNSVLTGYQQNITSVSGFGTPLATNGVLQWMPQTGGRPDIGYTTQYNTVWLVTQDFRAAVVGLAQGDAAGAVPWNIKLTSNGHWLTPYDSTQIWVDERSSSTVVANLPDYNDSGWQPDPAHQPNLSYVPYIMTGSRWYLDRLNAEAAFDLSYDYTGSRCRTAACDTILNGGDQIRQQAWSLREIEEAAFIGIPNSFEQGYFTTVINDNWSYVQSQESSLQSAGGQVYGYWGLGDYGTSVIPEWEDDYLTGTAVLGAEMGSSGALQFINWQKDAWLAGRFIGSGMNPYDGCNYNLVVANNSGVPYTTWTAIESATVAANLSNGANNSTDWVQSAGDYCQLARAVLGGALTLYSSDNSLKQALTWLNGTNFSFINQAAFQSDPTFNVVPLQ